MTCAVPENLMNTGNQSSSRTADKFLIRINNRLHARLAAVAEMNNRSANSELLTAISAWISGPAYTDAHKTIYIEYLGQELADATLESLDLLVFPIQGGSTTTTIRFKNGMSRALAELSDQSAKSGVRLSQHTIIINALGWWLNHCLIMARLKLASVELMMQKKAAA